MNVIKYRYYITYTLASNITTQEVFPIGVDKLKFKDSRNDGQIFTRKSLQGKLIFINQPTIPANDYDLFYSIDSSIDDKCREISLDVQRSCDNGITYSSYWLGYFSTTDGTFDTDKCIFSTECKIDDEYRCYIDGFETEFNLAAVPASDNITASIATQYEFHTCRDTEGNCDALRPFNGDSVDMDGTWLVFNTDTIDGITTTIYYREIAIVACQDGVAVSPSGNNWVNDLSYGCTAGLSRWVRTPLTVVTNNPNPDVAAGNCNAFATELPPHTQRLTVTKQGTTPSPVIVGKSVFHQIVLCNNPVACKDYWFVKFPKSNATYAWSITGAGNTIISGGATSVVRACFESNGTIKVIETTACGASTQISQTVNVTAGHPSYNADVRILGNVELCEGETAIYKLNSTIGLVGTLINVVGAGGTLYTDLADGFGSVTITAGSPGSFRLTYIAIAGFDCDVEVPPYLDVTILAKKHIEPIYGADTVCNTDICTYSIPETDLGGYHWEVIGGTILSGQGTEEVSIQWDGSNGTGYVFVAQEFNCGCGWIKISSCNENGTGVSYYWCPADANVSIKNTTLESVIDYIKDRLCIGIDAESDFFEWNPPGDTPGYIAGTNYITGQANELTYNSLISMRAAVYAFTGDADFANPTIDEVITWKDIEEILREVYNAYWFIDSNGNLRIEHYSWFNRTVTYDLTDAYYIKYSIGKNIYSYDKTKAPKIERFKWKQAISTDFVGADIMYSGTCVSVERGQQVKNRGVSNVTTDLIYINTLGISAGRDGFVLIANDSSFNVISETGLISGLLIPNAHLSWSNLHYNYHRHNRVLLNGMMNLISQTFLSALRFKKQEPVSFPFCCTDNLNTLEDAVTTGIGDGIVDEAEHDLKTDMIKVTLLHDF